MSWFFASDGQSIGTSASTPVLPMNIQGWFPLGLTGLISLQSKGFSRVFSSTTIWKHQFFGAQPSLWSNSHLYMTAGKNHSFDYKDLCWQSDVENLCPHKIPPRDSHSETEQDPMVLSHCILHLTLWKNLNQRITLIKEMRKCKNKGKQSNKTK